MKVRNKKLDSSKKKSGLSAQLKSEHFKTDVYYGMSFARINDDTVISRDDSNNALCFFKDDVWYFARHSLTVLDNPCFDFSNLYQDSLLNEENVKIAKKLFLMKMYAEFPKKGKPLRISTMHAVRHLLLQMTRHCNLKNILIEMLFENIETFKNFYLELSFRARSVMLQLVRTVCRINSSDRGFLIDRMILPCIVKDTRPNQAYPNQVPAIPSRILLFKYHQYHSYLDDFLKNFTNIQAILKKSAKDPTYGKSHATYARYSNVVHPQSREEIGPLATVTFDAAIKKHKLVKIANKLNWDRIVNILSFITTVAHCAKSLIHIYTLMRDHEVRALSTNCLIPVRGWNNAALYVASLTTKSLSQIQEHKWITTDAILKPIDVLKKIHKILSPYNKNPSDLLLISTSNHPSSNLRHKSEKKTCKHNFEDYLPPAIITEDDILELESLDPLRDWRSDKRFKVGSPWRITSHQFRRTMTIFCAQTGLITLPSLRRLLGHLTKTLALYYGKGCSAGTYKFDIVNPELCKQVKQATAEANGAMFIKEAIHSSEKLYGIKGRQIMADRKRGVWLESGIEETVAAAKRGLIAWTETALGGCSSTKPCDKRAHGNFFSCPGCLHLVAKKSAMDEARTIMEYDLAKLKKGSFEHRAEKQNLEDFIALCDRIVRKA